MTNKPLNTFSTQLSKTIDKHLDAYIRKDGVSIDAYYDKPCFHPMAEGKYLSSLSELFSTDKITKTFFENKVNVGIKRLKNNSTSLQGENICWGLGFKYKKGSINEPYLITTAVILSGLNSIIDLGIQSPETLSLQNSAIRSLEYWLKNFTVKVDKKIDFPKFSLSVGEPVFNPGIFAISISKNPLLHEEVSDWIQSHYHPKLGWSYSPGNHRIDLLHQAYILNSFAKLNGAKSVEQKTIDLIGQFSNFDGFIDSGDFHAKVEGLFDSKIPLVRAVGDGYFEVIPKSARLWSLGELLVLVSKLSQHGEHKKSWINFGRKISCLILNNLDSNNPEVNYYRHTMHAIHGLSSFLASMRSKN